LQLFAFLRRTFARSASIQSARERVGAALCGSVKNFV
jgi:hypothetical protein